MGPNGFSDRGGDDGILAMGWGSGTDNFPYLISPYEAIQARARKDRSSVNWWFNNWNLPGAAGAVQQQEVAVRCPQLSLSAPNLMFHRLSSSTLTPERTISQSTVTRVTGE